MSLKTQINPTLRSVWIVNKLFLTSGSRNMDFGRIGKRTKILGFDQFWPFFGRFRYFLPGVPILVSKKNIFVGWNGSLNLLPQKVVTHIQKFPLAILEDFIKISIKLWIICIRSKEITSIETWIPMIEKLYLHY